MTESVVVRTNAIPDGVGRDELYKLLLAVQSDLANLQGTVLTGSATYDPPAILTLSSAETQVSVPGAQVGDFVLCAFSLTTSGINITGYVSSPGIVDVVFDNGTSGTLNIASGTLRVAVLPKNGTAANNGMLYGAVVYDAASLANNLQLITSCTVRGAALNDYVLVSANTDLLGLTVSGYVQAAGNVSIVIQNDTGATIDLTSTTFNVRVIPDLTWAKCGIFAGLAGTLTATGAFDAASATTLTNQITTLSCTGCKLGDFVIASLGIDQVGMYLTGYVSVNDTVSVSLQNNTTGTVNLASATLTVRVIPQAAFPASALNTLA